MEPMSTLYFQINFTLQDLFRRETWQHFKACLQTLSTHSCFLLNDVQQRLSKKFSENQITFTNFMTNSSDR